MEKSQAEKNLYRALKAVFDAVPKAKRSMLVRDMMYVETLAICGVGEYTDQCNRKESRSEQGQTRRAAD